MKKLIIYFMTVCMMLSFTGCVNITINTPEKSPRPTQSRQRQNTPEGDVQQQPVDPTPEPAEEFPQLTGDRMTALYEEWAALTGYWNTVEKRFVILDMEDSHTAAFSEGVWEAGGGRGYGRVTGIKKSGDMEFTIKVYYPHKEATNAEPEYEELEQIVVIDYSGKEQDGKIRIKIGEEDYLQYRFAGLFSQVAYDNFRTDYYGE